MDKYARRIAAMAESAAVVKGIFGALGDPELISLGIGAPAKEALPVDILREISNDVLRTDSRGIEALQYGPTAGVRDLQEVISEMLLAPKGISVSPDRIMVTVGGLEAISLTCELFIEPGDIILVEKPTFIHAVETFEMFEAKCVGVEMDDDGMIMEDLEEKIRKYNPKMIYVIPTFQNPSGRTLSLERRKRIAQLASEYGVVVAEDDPYRDLRYTGTELPSIKSFDQEGWVAFMGSFSKVISPGLRVGYLVAHPSILRKCTVGKQSTDVHTALVNQAVVDQYLRQGLLMPHVENIRKAYGEKADAMLQMLSKCGGVARYTRPEGGLFIFCELEEGRDATALLKKAVDKGVAYVPGTHFYAYGGHDNTFRLNFSMPSVEQIKLGMEKLNDVFSK